MHTQVPGTLWEVGTVEQEHDSYPKSSNVYERVPLIYQYECAHSNRLPSKAKVQFIHTFTSTSHAQSGSRSRKLLPGSSC